MNAFVVEVENRPGEMARVLEPLATQEVNILGSGLGLGSKGAIVFVANDEDRARSALRGAKIGYREVPVIHVSLEDKPGQALRVSKKLADAGVNIEVFLPVQAAGGESHRADWRGQSGARQAGATRPAHHLELPLDAISRNDEIHEAPAPQRAGASVIPQSTALVA